MNEGAPVSKRPAPGRVGEPRPAARGRRRAGAAPAEPRNIDPHATRRGLIVVAITVLVGAVVFWQGVHKPAEQAAAAGPPTALVASTAPTNAANPTTTVAPTTTAVLPTVTKVAPKDLKIMVTNGVDPAKPIATPMSVKLRDAGYPLPRSVDLPKASDRSFVYAPDELRADALAVAKALGWPETVVAPLPTPTPVDVGQARVLVVIGKDRA